MTMTSKWYMSLFSPKFLLRAANGCGFSDPESRRRGVLFDNARQTTSQVVAKRHSGPLARNARWGPPCGGLRTGLQFVTKITSRADATGRKQAVARRMERNLQPAKCTRAGRRIRIVEGYRGAQRPLGDPEGAGRIEQGSATHVAG